MKSITNFHFFPTKGVTIISSAVSLTVPDLHFFSCKARGNNTLSPLLILWLCLWCQFCWPLLFPLLLLLCPFPVPLPSSKLQIFFTFFGVFLSFPLSPFLIRRRSFVSLVSRTSSARLLLLRRELRVQKLITLSPGEKSLRKSQSSLFFFSILAGAIFLEHK